jgi:hypothetical protein
VQYVARQYAHLALTQTAFRWVRSFCSICRLASKTTDATTNLSKNESMKRGKKLIDDEEK